MSEEFFKALKTNNKQLMATIPKGDIHNHGTKGGSIEVLEEWVGIKLKRPPEVYNDLNSMLQWFNAEIAPYFKGKWGYEKKTEAAFIQAKEDGVKLLKMSIDVKSSILYKNSVDKLTEKINKIHQEVAPNIKLIPEIGINRSTDFSYIERVISSYLDCEYFKSIDLYGNELSGNISDFAKIYSKAKSKGLLLNAHVGEYGDAESIKKAVEILELDHVQHGIAAESSTEVMDWLAKNRIQLNICPSSNVRLKRIKNYDSHPIRKIFDKGIKVTINTDDYLCFNQSVSDEYFNLYNAGVFSAIELNEIRKNSISI